MKRLFMDQSFRIKSATCFQTGARIRIKWFRLLKKSLYIISFRRCGHQRADGVMREK